MLDGYQDGTGKRRRAGLLTERGRFLFLLLVAGGMALMALKGEHMKTTRREYLIARGWIRSESHKMEWWNDPRHYGRPSEESGGLTLATAVAIQLSRDEEECRDLYRRVMAARMGIGQLVSPAGTNVEPAFSAKGAAYDASDAVAAYRAEFLPIFTDESE